MTAGEPDPGGASQPEGPAVPQLRLPRRQRLELDPDKQVSMTDLAIEHGRSGTANAENQTAADTQLGEWLRRATNDELLALLAGGANGVPDEVAQWIRDSEAHHAQDGGNSQLQPSQWMQEYILNLLQQRRSGAAHPTSAPEPYHARHLDGTRDPGELLGTVLRALRADEPQGDPDAPETQTPPAPPQRGTVYRSGDPGLR